MKEHETYHRINSVIDEVNAGSEGLTDRLTSVDDQGGYIDLSPPVEPEGIHRLIRLADEAIFSDCKACSARRVCLAAGLLVAIVINVAMFSVLLSR